MQLQESNKDCGNYIVAIKENIKEYTEKGDKKILWCDYKYS